MNPYAIIAALVIWIATGAGAWFYRGHIDSGDVLAAQNAVAAAADAKVAKLKIAADAATKAAQDAADARALTLQQQIDNERTSYDAKLVAARAALRKLPSCPVPLADVGMLITQPTSSSGSGQRKQGDPGPAPGSSTEGTVEASAVIASCEYNRGAFERNLQRLDSCIASYDAARAEVNGKK